MNYQLLLKLVVVDTHLSFDSNRSQPAVQTSSVRVSGRAGAVGGGNLLSWWAYSVSPCGLNRWGGGKVLCSTGSRAGNWLAAGPGGNAVRRGREEEEGGGGGHLFFSCRPPSFCLTAPWPPSWFPAGPGVTWSLWAPGRGPLRGVAGSARPLQREKRLRTPDCRVWPEQLHLRGKSQQTDQQHILFIML